MSIFSLIFTTLFVIIIILAFFNTKWSVTLFIAYSLLVPMVQIFIGSISIGSRFMYLLLVIIYFIKHGTDIRKVSYVYFKPFILLLGLYAVEIFFQPSGLMSISYTKLLEQFLGSILYPMVIYSLICIDHTSFKHVLYALLISGCVFTGYGLFLTTMPGVNPYLMITLPLFGQEFNEAYALGYSALATNYGDVVEGRMFGRISSVFMHPMTYGLNLGLLAMVAFYTFKDKSKSLIGILSIIMIAILTSGIRTPFVAFILTIVVALSNLKKTKLMVYAIVIGMVFIFTLPMVSPEMNDFVTSALGAENPKTSGSNISMRLEQFYGCFDIIKDDLFFGKGYTWTSVYMAKYTTHPVLLCFESLVFSVLCNNGLFGVLIWTIFVFSYLKMVKFSFENVALQTFILSLFAYYFFFSLITGDYGYMQYFMVYYAVSLGFTQNYTYGLKVYEQ